MSVKSSPSGAILDPDHLLQAGTNAMAVVLHTITKLNGGQVIHVSFTFNPTAHSKPSNSFIGRLLTLLHWQTPDFVWSMEHLCEMLEIMMSYTVCKALPHT